jgi:poly(3-hydroxybutyrate) depolymerase
VSNGVKAWTVRYRANSGLGRPAIVLVPAQYGPNNPPPHLPLVISPHGRGIRAATNAQNWGELPARGNFAVICPGGMGRRLPLHSWGWGPQIDDLAKMPSVVRRTLEWMRIDLRKVYAVGGSMGGQETLLLVAHYPEILAGAVAFDSVTNFYIRYRDFPKTSGGLRLQALARIEVGGTPKTNPMAYTLRSPNYYLSQVARSGVPLQLWWSDADEIVTDQDTQSGTFYRGLKRLGTRGPLEKVTGSWGHTEASYSQLQLPGAVRWLGLVPH